MAKCPKCEKTFSNVRCEHVDVNASGGDWHGVAYSCPWCQSALGVEIDPIALKTDIVNQLMQALRK
jgi:hypothetical protein